MGPGEVGLSRAYILKAVERSLNRLQVDTIDLYQAHKDDPNTPLEETLGAFAELIRAGKVRAIGASNYSAARLADALTVSQRLGLPRYESLQPEYNLYDRAGFEAELEPLCRRENLGVIPYFSLAAGFLTGKYRSADDVSKSPRGAKVKNYLNDRGFRILAALDQVAGRLKETPARVARATSVEQLSDLVAATRLNLDPEMVRVLDEASR
jgi:aryl-alcohol dehydrogenase-like predicted oxidoreductase